MIYCRFLTSLIFLALFASSCLTSKGALDQGIIVHSNKKQTVIRELAEFAVAYTIGKSRKKFNTDTLSDRAMKRKFTRNGYGGLITVTYSDTDNDKVSGLIDSTVIFEQMTLKGITEIIYDFAATEREFKEDRTNPQQFVFLYVANRIYYRRRPVPMM